MGSRGCSSLLCLCGSRAHGRGSTGWCWLLHPTGYSCPGHRTPLVSGQAPVAPRTQISMLWCSQPRSCCSRALVAALCALRLSFNPHSTTLFPTPTLQSHTPCPTFPWNAVCPCWCHLHEPHPHEAAPPCIPRWHLRV